MFTLSDDMSAAYRIKGSKFIGFLSPVSSVPAFEQRLAEVRGEHPGATHHCYAYRIDPVEPHEFDQDDGEPGGTAGKPILNKMRSARLINAGLIVVRYFGGTKLGTSGLVQAYGHTASLCIEAASLLETRLTQQFRITYPYSEQNLIEKLKHRWDLVEIKSTYREQVTLTLGCTPEQAYQFKSYLKQQAARENLSFNSLGIDYVVLRPTS
jgi:uncharacterized YigZ family protein